MIKRNFSQSEDEDRDSDDEKTEPKVELDEKPVLKPHHDNEWSLICSSTQEWSDIVNKYENAKSRNEKSLLKGLKDLNGIIPELFADKEKTLQKKLLALAPRRSSDRILIKVQIREEEERRKEQERILKTQQKVKEAEKRQKELQIEKEKEREKRYQERERNLELRALRAKQREELKLVAENPELAKELQLANKDKKTYSMKLDLDGEEDDKYFAMDRVLEVVKDDDDAWPFLEPVNYDEAPNYYDFIKEPMDLSTIASKIKSKKYKDKTEFEDDMYLIFDNCETYNGTHSSYTKLAFKIKKVFERQMKKEFPPEKANKDELYEDDDKKKNVKMKTPKEQHLTALKAVKEKKLKEPTVYQSLKKNNFILTPEFAHAQILQAQAQKIHAVQDQQQSIQGPNIPQILPKLGIPQEVLAKLTPAQMQSLLMQLRAGTLSSLNVGGHIAPKTSASLQRSLSTNSQGSSHLNITPNSIVNIKKQGPRLMPKNALSIAQMITTPNNISSLKIASPGTIIRPNSNTVQYVATPNGQIKNLSFLNTKNLPNAPNSSKISTVLHQKTPATSQTLLGKNVSIPSTLHTITPVKTTKTSPMHQSPFSGTLVIQGKNSNVLPQLKKLETPILGQSNIRYVGQPNGQLQKIVYLQTPNSSPIRQQTLSKVMTSQIKTATIRAALSPNTQMNRSSGQTQSRQVVPIYLTSQGVPLQVVRPGTSTVLANSSAKLSDQLAASKVSISNQVLVKTSSSTPIATTNIQNLQGLKKAVQQVAAVTQISAKLQNHMENKNLLPRPAEVVDNKNKVIIKPLNNNKKVLNSPIAMKVPVASLQSPYVLSTTSTTPKIVASTVTTTGTTVILSPVRSVGNTIQMQSIKGLLPGSKQSNVSFILTSNGLVSISLPSSIAPKLAVLSDSVASTQNIITSRIPSVFMAQAKPTVSMTSAAPTSMAVKQAVVRSIAMPSLATKQVVSSASSSSVVAQQSIPYSNSFRVTPMVVQQALSRSNLISSASDLQQLIPRSSTSIPSASSNRANPSSVITPEKLRDAEALLGLINPTHLKPVSSSNVTKSKSDTQYMTPSSNNGMNTPLKTVSSLTNGSPVKVGSLPFNNIKISPHQKSIITSPLKSQVKIQLPSAQKSSQAISSPPTLTQTSNAMKTNNGSVVTGPKMVVDAAQLLKLREEGKLMVSSNGQMFLLANTTSPQKPSK